MSIILSSRETSSAGEARWDGGLCSLTLARAPIVKASRANCLWYMASRGYASITYSALDSAGLVLYILQDQRIHSLLFYYCKKYSTVERNTSIVGDVGIDGVIDDVWSRSSSLKCRFRGPTGRFIPTVDAHSNPTILVLILQSQSTVSGGKETEVVIVCSINGCLPKPLRMDTRIPCALPLQPESVLVADVCLRAGASWKAVHRDRDIRQPHPTLRNSRLVPNHQKTGERLQKMEKTKKKKKEERKKEG